MVDFLAVNLGMGPIFKDTIENLQNQGRCDKICTLGHHSSLAKYGGS